MKLWVELWVRLKVVDLVAQTAWITLTEKLDFAGRIHGLIRYNYWGFSAGGENGGTMIGEIDRVVRFDSAFTNQNKHCYRLMAFAGDEPRGGTAGENPRDGTGPAAPASDAGTPAAAAFVRGDLALERDYALRSEADADRNASAGGRGASAARGEGLYAVDCLIRERHGDREAAFEGRLNARLRGVRVSALKAGELWRVVVSARSGGEAAETVEEMAVTRSRREGLLLNPHYQTLEVLSTRRLSL